MVKCVSVKDNFKERLVQFAVSVHRAAEDYLEAMLMMRERHGYIRSIDIAEHLGVTKPSVTYATKRLKQNGFITMDRDGLITLTESGMEIADRIYTRHKTLTEFFMRIGVDEKTAREDACKVLLSLCESVGRRLRASTSWRDKSVQRSATAISGMYPTRCLWILPRLQ